MHQITRINHVGLRVTDLETSRAFYGQLGFEFIAGPIGPEPVAIMEHACGVNINLILNSTDSESHNVLMDTKEKHTGYTHMSLEVTDMKAMQRQLAALDIRITEGPITTNNGSTMMFIRDPDSNVIEFHEPAHLSA